jgi:predicted alpha/beta hydrolase
LRARLPQGSPLHWLGHSLGGQIVGMVPSRHRLHSVTTIACGSGYWRQNALGLRWRAPLLWHVIAPLAMTVSGYFPGRRLGMIGDLPLQAMRRWRSWCLQPDYFMADPAMNADDALRRQYAALRMPLLSLSFADDEYMSARNIDALHGYYARATRTMRRITSQDVGGQRVGHFGFFRETFRESLWPQLPVWWSRLDSTSNAAQP